MKRWLLGKGKPNFWWHAFLVVTMVLTTLLGPLGSGTAQAVAPWPPARSLPSTVNTGQTFNVTVTFSAPDNNFNAIGLSEFAPDGWTVAVGSPNSPAVDSTLITDNRIDYVWFGPYTSGSSFSAVYQVTVPNATAPGSYSFSGYIEYYLLDGIAHTANVTGSSTVIVPDTTAPTVLGVAPPNGVTQVPVDTPIIAIFSESMNTTTVQSAFSISPPVSGLNFNWTDSNNLTVTHSSNFNYATNYTVTIGTGAKDLSGNGLATAKVWSFKTYVRPPTVTTLSAQNITANSTVLGAGVNMGDFTTANLSWAVGTSNTSLNFITPESPKTTTNAYGLLLLGLASNTKYYFQARLRASGLDLLTGEILDFTTLKSPLQVITVNATAVKAKTATINGFLNALGDYSSANVSFLWGTDPDTPSFATDNQTMYGTGAFSANLTGLQPSTTYYFNARAGAEGQTVFGVKGSFKTSAVPTQLVITPDSAFIKPGIQQYKATANFTDNTSADVTTLVEWHSTNLTVATINATSGLAQGLTDGTTLIWAIFYYGIESTDEVSTQTDLTVDGTSPSVTVYYPNGGQYLAGGKQYNIEWAAADANMAANPITIEYFNGTTWVQIAANEANDGVYPWTVPSTVNTSNASVKVRAVDKAGNEGTDVSNSSFTIDSVRPTVSSTSPASGATNVPVTTTINFTLSESMNFTSVQNAFSTSPYVIGALSFNGTTKIFTPTANLSYNTLYTVSVNNSALDWAGNQLVPYSWSFTTAKEPPAVVTSTAAGITTNSATLFGYLSKLGSYNPVNVSFVFGTSPGSSTNSTTPVSMTGTGPFSANLTGLTINTKYYFRAKATTADGTTVYGNELNFTTAQLTAINVVPPNVVVPLGRPFQFKAIGSYLVSETGENWTGEVTALATWSSSNPSSADVGLHTGLATTMGKQPGATTITAAIDTINGTANLTVGPKELEGIGIRPQTPIIPVGRSVNFTALGFYSDTSNETITTSVNWTSTNPSIATIDATGNATGVKLGQTEISATRDIVTANGTAKRVKSNLAKLTVKEAVLDSIIISPSTASVPKGETEQFTAEGVYSDGTRISIVSANWSSSNTTVAVISSTGLAYGRAQGTTNITVRLAGIASSNYAVLTVDPPEIEGVKIIPQNPIIALGTVPTISFNAIAFYSDGSFTDNTSTATWSSSNTSVATVNTTTGVFNIVGQGQTTINATIGALSGSTVLTVVAPVLRAVQIDDAYPATDNAVPAMSVGSTVQLYLTGRYSDNSSADLTGTAIWYSTNTGVLTITAGGLVTGAAPGSANITAIHSGLKSSVRITITQPPAVAAKGAYPVGDTTATLNGVLVSLGTSSSANVSFEWGLISGSLNETTTVQPMTGAGAFTAGLTGLTASTTYYFRAKAVGHGTRYSGEQSFVTSSLPPTVTTGTASNVTNNSATINGALSSVGSATSVNVSFEWGLTTAYGNQTSLQPFTTGANFSAALSGLLPSTTYHYRARAEGMGTSYGLDGTFKTAKALIGVGITPSNPWVPKGRTVQLTAVGGYSDGTLASITANWLSSDSGVASVDSSGLVTGNAIGTVTITATDPTTGKSGTTSVKVLPAVLESINVNGPTPFAAGLTRQYNATGRFSDNSTSDITTSVLWSTDATGIVFVDAANGLVTGKNAGSANITATRGKISGAAPVTITPATLTRVQVVPSTSVIPVGESQQFKAVGIYSDGRMRDLTDSVTWTSDNTAVAANPVRGLAIGGVEGFALITANETASGKFGTANLTVKQASLVEITISANQTSIPSGRVERFYAIGTYTGNTTADITHQVAWASSNETTARINAAGVANSFAPGSTEITASQGDVTSNSLLLTITDPVLDALYIRPVNPRIVLISGGEQHIQMNAFAIFSGGLVTDNTTEANWDSSDTGVADFDSTPGLATIIGEGTTTITATLGTASRTTTLTVLPDKLAPVVTLSSPTEGLVLSEKSIEVSGKVDDESADVIAIVNSTVYGVSLNPETGSFSQVVPLKSGWNSVKVRAIDDAGNTGASGTVTIFVDTEKVKPTITITKPLPEDRLTNIASLSVEGTISGNVSSANLIFNGSLRTIPVTGGNFAADVTLTKGINIIVVNAYTSGYSGYPDYLGTSGIIAVELDTNAPIVKISSPVSGTITSDRLAEVSGTVDDSWVTSVVITINDIPEMVDLVKGAFSHTITLQPGENTILVEATDEAGNRGTDDATVTLDTSVPGVTISSPANKLITNSASQLVTGNVTDLSITVVNLILNGSTQEIPVAPDGSFSQAITLVSGENSIEVTASDAAVPPNVGTSGKIYVTLDNTPPALIAGLSNPTESVLITVTSDETLQGLPVVKITGTSDGIEIDATVDMVEVGINKWTGTYGSEADPILPGEYTATVTGIDEAGNAASATATFGKKTIDVNGVDATTVSTQSTTLEIQTKGAVNNVDISISQHIDNPSGNVGKPGDASAEVGVFLEINAPPELTDNLQEIRITVNYDPSTLPAGTDESTLKLYLWDVSSGTWKVVNPSGTDVDNVTGQHYIWGIVRHLSKYGGFGSAVTTTQETPDGGGGGGGITYPASISGLTSPTSLRVDGSGYVVSSVLLTTTDGKATLGIAGGTQILNSTGGALTSITASVLVSPPAAPSQNAILASYSFGPDGAVFKPSIQLTMSYDPTKLSGVSEDSLYLAYWNGSQWVAITSTVNKSNHTISATITHFTTFAVLGTLPTAQPTVPVLPTTPTTPTTPTSPVTPTTPTTPTTPVSTPATFKSSALTISPIEVNAGDTVTIGVLVQNTGDLTGTYKVVLKINGVEVATQDVTLAGHDSKTVDFNTSRDAAGTYSVTIDSLAGSFTVKGAGAKPTGISPAVIIAIVAAVVIIGLLVFLFTRKKKPATP